MRSLFVQIEPRPHNLAPVNNRNRERHKWNIETAKATNKHTTQSICCSSITAARIEKRSEGKPKSITINSGRLCNKSWLFRRQILHLSRFLNHSASEHFRILIWTSHIWLVLIGKATKTIAKMYIMNSRQGSRSVNIKQQLKRTILVSYFVTRIKLLQVQDKCNEK